MTAVVTGRSGDRRRVLTPTTCLLCGQATFAALDGVCRPCRRVHIRENAADVIAHTALVSIDTARDVVADLDAHHLLATPTPSEDV